MSDLSVLDFDHLPERLPNRNQELQAIAGSLRRLAGDINASPVRIYGPSGVGKSTVARLAAHEAAHAYRADYAVVDCIEHRTRAATLHAVARELGMVATHQGTPTQAYHQYFRENVEKAIVVLDEVSQLEDYSVIREIYATDGLTPIVVTHDGQQFERRISESLGSRLRTGRQVQCDRYDTDELVEILEARLREGGMEGAANADALGLIADLAAGNARDAIATLKEAIEYVGPHDTVTETAVTEVREQARERVIRRNLLKMDTEHRVIYRIIRDAGEIKAGGLKHRIASELDVSDRQRRRFLEALEYENAIETEGSGRGVVYRPILKVSLETANPVS